MSGKPGHAGIYARQAIDAAVQAEYGLSLEETVCEMFAAGYPLRIIASTLDVCYQFVHNYVRELGLQRPRIRPERSAPVRERVRMDVCAERVAGATWTEIRARHNVSASVVAHCLRAGAPDYIGTRHEPVTYSDLLGRRYGR